MSQEHFDNGSFTKPSDQNRSAEEHSEMNHSTEEYPSEEPASEPLQFSAPDLQKEKPIYLVIKSTCVSNEKPEYKIYSITPEGQQVPVPTYEERKGYDKYTVVGELVVDTDETFVVDVGTEEYTDVMLIGSSMDRTKAEGILEDELSKVIGEDKTKREWKYDTERNVMTVQATASSGVFWWDIIEVGFSTQAGFSLPKS